MYAAIDIGSNTILLLVARTDNGGLKKVAEKQRAPRLGQGIDTQGRLSPRSIERAIAIVNDFKEFVYRHYSNNTPIFITGTSAIRDAVNSRELIRRIKEATGLKLEVIGGKKEARLTFLGALSTVSVDKKQPQLVVDVGGGSTELIYGTSREIYKLHSYQMGSVRYSERFLRSDPPAIKDITACRKAIYKQFEQETFNVQSFEGALIGVEGTVTSLAHILKGTPGQYKPGLINGTHITADKIREEVRRLSNMSVYQLLSQYPQVMEGRADVFLGGVLILEGLLHTYNLETMIVSEGGIRHGTILYHLT